MQSDGLHEFLYLSMPFSAHNEYQSKSFGGLFKSSESTLPNPTATSLLILISIPVRVRVHSERTSAAARPVAYYPRRPPTHRPAGMSAAAALQSMVVSAYPGPPGNHTPLRLGATDSIRTQAFSCSLSPLLFVPLYHHPLYPQREFGLRTYPAGLRVSSRK